MAIGLQSPAPPPFRLSRFTPHNTSPPPPPLSRPSKELYFLRSLFFFPRLAVATRACVMRPQHAQRDVVQPHKRPHHHQRLHREADQSVAVQVECENPKFETSFSLTSYVQGLKPGAFSSYGSTGFSNLYSPARARTGRRYISHFVRSLSVLHSSRRRLASAVSPPVASNSAQVPSRSVSITVLRIFTFPAAA
jgi:hypothetical protein